MCSVIAGLCWRSFHWQTITSHGRCQGHCWVRIRREHSHCRSFLLHTCTYLPFLFYCFLLHDSPIMKIVGLMDSSSTTASLCSEAGSSQRLHVTWPADAWPLRPLSVVRAYIASLCVISDNAGWCIRVKRYKHARNLKAPMVTHSRYFISSRCQGWASEHREGAALEEFMHRTIEKKKQ